MNVWEKSIPKWREQQTRRPEMGRCFEVFRNCKETTVEREPGADGGTPQRQRFSSLGPLILCTRDSVYHTVALSRYLRNEWTSKQVYKRTGREKQVCIASGIINHCKNSGFYLSKKSRHQWAPSREVSKVCGIFKGSVDFQLTKP